MVSTRQIQENLRDRAELTRSQKIQATKQAKRDAARPSIAHLVHISEGSFAVATDELDFICPNIETFNNLIVKLGYKPVRVTYNMLNKEAGPIVIDADTPSYCDVGSESYWSM